MCKRKIIILIDYLDAIYSIVGSHYGLNKTQFKHFLFDKGFDVEFKRYYEVDFKHENYNGLYVIYQSAEIPDLKYKGYIEDVLLGLQEQGAILIPKFKYFRAHHNKVFQEILRDLSSMTEIKNLGSKYYGTYEDYINDQNLENSEPVVFKLSEGSGSRSVSLLNNFGARVNVPKKYSEVKEYRSLGTVIKNTLLLLKKRINFIKTMPSPITKYRNKFIIQTLAKDLKGDYKVLIFGKKYFVLKRENRENDFRASGSGKFSFPKDDINNVLDFSKSVFDSFGVPFISIDVGYNGDELFLIEFQFVMFGTYTIEAAPHFFIKEDIVWRKKCISAIVEKEYANSISWFINKEFE